MIQLGINKLTNIEENDTVNKTINSDTDESISNLNDDSSGQSSSSDDIESEISHDFDDVESDISENEAPEVIKKNFNIFNENLKYRKRKVHKNKLNLEVVREFCHDACRMDTFNSSQKIQVHNYDGSFEYHSVHIRNQSIKEYFKIFLMSIFYARWQNENTITNEKGIVKIPTIRFRSFSNGFCPCCLNQKQRDCANHVQVN